MCTAITNAFAANMNMQDDEPRCTTTIIGYTMSEIVSRVSCWTLVNFSLFCF